MVIWILYLLVLCLGLVHFRKKFSQFLFLAALFAIPFLGELTVSILRPIFYDRTLIWTTIPLYLVVAAGIAQLRFRFVIIMVLGILARSPYFLPAIITGFIKKRIGAPLPVMLRVLLKRMI